MQIPNPKKMIQARKDKKSDRAEVISFLEKRLEYALSEKNYKERLEIFNAFKAKGVNALIFKGLVETAANNVGVFLRKEIRSMKGTYSRGTEVTTLAHVKEGEPFSKILVVVRDLYALDIAQDISCEDAARVVMEKIFFHT